MVVQINPNSAPHQQLGRESLRIGFFVTVLNSHSVQARFSFLGRIRFENTQFRRRLAEQIEPAKSNHMSWSVCGIDA